MSDEAELIAKAELGEEGRKFLDGDLGRYLIGAAQQDRQLALEKLAEVAPGDVNKIMELQVEARCGLRFEAWLTNLIADGENALNVWRQQKAES